MAVIRACAEMLSRLEAEEALSTVVQTAVGTGSVKPGRARAILSAWRRAAGMGRGRPLRSLTATDLAAMGLAVRRVPKPTETVESADG